MADPTLVPVYTGNNITIQINPGAGGQPQDVALVQTLTISRMVNRRAVYQINTPFWVDQPVTQIGVTVSATAMVAIPPNDGLSGAAPTPAGSLIEALTAPAQTFSCVDESGTQVATVTNALFQQDSLEVVANDPLTYNASWVAQDATIIS